MNKRSKELLKSLVLVLLLINALILVFMAGTGRGFPSILSSALSLSPFSGSAVPAGDKNGASGPTEASRPAVMALMNESGRRGLMYSDSALDSAYVQFGKLLGEALATADSPEKAHAARFQEALLLPGAYFEFPANLPVSALGAWLGVEQLIGELERFAFRYCIYAEGGRVRLMLSDGSDFYAFDTAISHDIFNSALGDYDPNGDFFVFELDGGRLSYVNCDPFSLIPAGTSVSIPAISSTNSALDKGKKNNVITALGFNPYTVSGYTDASGTMVYVENRASFSISSKGLLSYKRIGDAAAEGALAPIYQTGSPNSSDSSALIETARYALESLLPKGGAAKLWLTGFEHQDDETLLSFDYFVNGIMISFENAHGASVTIKDGSITQLHLYLREYTVLRERLSLMPPLQIAAVLEQEGLNLLPQYLDSDYGPLSAGWVGRSY